MSFEVKEKLFDFQRIANEIAREEENKFHAKLENKFSPTDLVTCIRQAYFNRIYPTEFNDKSYRNFLIGDTFHAIFQDKLNDKEFVKKVMMDKIQHVESEKGYIYLVPMEKVDGERVIISGRLDTIFFLKDQVEPIIVDYKSTANAYYNKDKAKLSHVKQLNFYLATNSANLGYLVYIDKRDMTVFQHEIPYSREMFDDMINCAIQLFWALKKKEVPIVNVPEHEAEGDCKYCPHVDICHKTEERLKLQK